jgi:hypothetical protein
MKNKMSDLHNHLMERVRDKSITGDDLTEELSRAQAVTEISREIIANAALCLRARQYATSVSFSGNTHLPPMLEV